MADVCDRQDSGRGMDIRHLRVSGRRRILSRIVVPLAAAVSTCLMTALVSSGQDATADTPNPFQQLINKVSSTQTPQNPPIPRSAGANANASANARAAALSPAAAVKMASQEQVRQLFLKGTVTGEDLKEELKAVKGAVRNASTQSALAEMVGQASAQIAGAKTHNFLTDLGGRLKEFAVDLLHQKAISYSDKVLTDFLTTLTGDDGALRKESITLPSTTASNMTLSQQQSVLLMAALVVGSRH